MERQEAIRTLALKLLSMPASSAAIERFFSNFGMIRSKLRNRLGISKAAKLVCCYSLIECFWDARKL